jgi:hypothetical protein
VEARARRKEILKKRGNSKTPNFDPNFFPGEEEFRKRTPLNNYDLSYFPPSSHSTPSLSLQNIHATIVAGITEIKYSVASEISRNFDLRNFLILSQEADPEPQNGDEETLGDPPSPPSPLRFSLHSIKVFSN